MVSLTAETERKAGDKLIQAILTMRGTRTTLKRKHNSLAVRIARADLKDASGLSSIELKTEYDEIAAKEEALKEAIKKKEAILAKDGEAGTAKLRRMVGSKFVEALVNAMATKTIIRDLLRARKLELARIMDDYQAPLGMYYLLSCCLLSIILILSLGQNSRHQTLKGVRSRSSRVGKLVRRFNELVGVMEKNNADAPRGVRVPERIAMKGLYTLGIDDPIWWDVGSLEDLDAAPGVVPKWLGDDNTRLGIIAMLDRKCAVTELERLKEERSSLQEWYVEADNAVKRAMLECGM